MYPSFATIGETYSVPALHIFVGDADASTLVYDSRLRRLGSREVLYLDRRSRHHCRIMRVEDGLPVPRKKH